MKTKTRPISLKLYDTISGTSVDTDIHDGNNRIIASQIPKEWAEFIVRAVNSHEALLEAAKLGLSWVEGEEGSDKSDSDFIKKAIAQAEAKP